MGPLKPKFDFPPILKPSIDADQVKVPDPLSRAKQAAAGMQKGIETAMNSLEHMTPDNLQHALEIAKETAPGPYAGIRQGPLEQGAEALRRAAEKIRG